MSWSSLFTRASGVQNQFKFSMAVFDTVIHTGQMMRTALRFGAGFVGVKV